MTKYAIGVDFGTLSGRALLVSLEDGEEIASCVMEYPHGVMDRTLPSGERLENGAAFQHPQDYLDVLNHTVKTVVAQSGVCPEDIVGLGIDFTSCTVLPVLEDGTPLCVLDEFSSDPHAYVKLWKHHSAQQEADEITVLAEERKESWLARYGGKVSSEWLLPKVLETLHKSPMVFSAAQRFVEAGDWLVWNLTGREVHSSCMAGYKGTWHFEAGYPSDSFLTALDPRLHGLAGTKISTKVMPAGTLAGGLTKPAAENLGLCAGTAVSVPVIDAHAALPAAGITGPGTLMMIMGTSTCHILMNGEEKEVPGICGVVKDGVLPGYFAYEAGQACVGDHFAWFMENCLPERFLTQAAAEGKSVYALMREKAALLAPGESGLLALDWWNGSRTPYVDADLSGLILGMTLKTRPEEIYRALIEATAFGTKRIIDTYEQHGVNIRSLCASGGIAEKDPLAMQIYADVCGREIQVAGSAQAGALGSAMFAAVASGYFQNMEQAAGVLARLKDFSYQPVAENSAVYNKLYDEYVTLCEYFAKKNHVMKRLKKV